MSDGAGNVSDLIFAVNGGSSSLKFAVFSADTRVCSGKIERIGQSGSSMTTRTESDSSKVVRAVDAPDQGAARAYSSSNLRKKAFFKKFMRSAIGSSTAGSTTASLNA